MARANRSFFREGCCTAKAQQHVACPPARDARGRSLRLAEKPPPVYFDLRCSLKNGITFSCKRFSMPLTWSPS
jgi:hypothetical protein